MKINIQNREKIEQILDEVQKRSSARTVTYENIKDLAETAEDHMNKHLIPKKLWTGCRASHAEKVNCNSYSRRSRTAQSTMIVIERGNKGWFLMSCDREEFYTSRGQGKDAQIRLSDQAAEWLRENIVLKIERDF